MIEKVSSKNFLFSPCHHRLPDREVRIMTNYIQWKKKIRKRAIPKTDIHDTCRNSAAQKREANINLLKMKVLSRQQSIQVFI